MHILLLLREKVGGCIKSYVGMVVLVPWRDALACQSATVCKGALYTMVPRCTHIRGLMLSYILCAVTHSCLH